jgi:hypothetical protein
LTIPARSSRSMTRCAVVNATASQSTTPLRVMKGFAPKSSTTRDGLLLDSQEICFDYGSSDVLRGRHYGP